MQKPSFSKEELLDCGHGNMFGIGNARLPLPPMLMFDRIIKITEDGGDFGKGEIIAEFDIDPTLWFFDCHFEKDPVMPGCLGLDAMWQLVGFFLGWIGEPGRGRALGAASIKFAGEILQDTKKVEYIINMKKVIKRGVVVGVGNGIVKADSKTIYSAEGLKVGLIK
ncbi:bifunctional 3-hydroxydecanoyl-ACP dehydratase/trans-2-decenoyl-ACP isomerase [Pelagibacterales bacterium]|nr:bifunctional 3-hydroxydecanoyl-ACP dehydratase/trans-2-decenoyl-ACP isomerase [Pelagibacterales bacterium]